MDTCRVCLITKNSLHSVWDMCADRLIKDLIGLTLQIEIRSDQDLPQSICCSCLKVLDDAHKLRKVAQRNETILFESDDAANHHFPALFQSPLPIFFQQQPNPFFNYIPYQQPPPQQQIPSERAEEIRRFFSTCQPTRAPYRSQQKQQENFRIEMYDRFESPKDYDTDYVQEVPLLSSASSEEGLSSLRTTRSVDSVELPRYRGFRSTLNQASTEIDDNSEGRNSSQEFEQHNQELGTVDDPEDRLRY